MIHWLPVAAWTDFKIIALVYKCLQGNAIEYLQNLVTQKPVFIRTLLSMYLKEANTPFHQGHLV